MLPHTVIPESTSSRQTNAVSLFPLLERAAKQWPGDIALVRGSHAFTFRQIECAAKRLASELARSKIESGCKVGLLCANGPEYVVGSFALFFVDAVVVPIFPGLKKREVAGLAAELGLDAYCYSPQFEDQLPESRQGDVTACTAQNIFLNIAGSSQRDAAGFERHRLARLGSPLIRFTSGTTSKAKGVIIPQPSMLEYTRRFARAYSIQRGDCILNLLSMSHIFYQVTAGMLQGVKLVIEDANKIDAIARAIREHRVTHIEAAPSFYAMLLAADDFRAEDLRHVKYITSCGAPLADNVAASFRRRFGREIVQRYGLTETGPVLINTDEDPRKRGSLGVAAPGCEVRLKDHGNDSAASLGEIQIRCAGLFHGYYVPWTPREDVLDDGWFCTGDVARRDLDGCYWITGRTKTIINVGAVKVFPHELESILLAHSQVKEAFVYANPDARFGEVPQAKVVLHAGSRLRARELMRYANKNLGVFKALRRLDIVHEIIKTPTGKIKRYEPQEG